jgi:hypothetical protein
MIAASFRFETAPAGWTRRAVRRNPIAEGRLETFKTTVGFARVVPSFVPDAVYQKAHDVLRFIGCHRKI